MVRLRISSQLAMTVTDCLLLGDSARGTNHAMVERWAALTDQLGVYEYDTLSA